MTQSPFRERLRKAIENRQSLETLDGAIVELDPEEDREWQRQIQLDHAIEAWKRGDRPSVIRPRRARQGAWVLSTVALGLAMIGSAWNFGPANRSDMAQLTVDVPVETVTEAVVAPRPERPVERTSIAVVHFAPAAALESPPAADRQAEFNRTADRLVYALEPVGQRVSAVVHRIIDAVPGAEVLATDWQYES